MRISNLESRIRRSSKDRTDSVAKDVVSPRPPRRLIPDSRFQILLLLLLASCAYYPTEQEEASALYRQARHNLAVGRDALALLDRAIELAPDRAEIYETRGGLHRDAARLEAARDDYAEAARLRPSADLLTRLGASEGELGYFDRAEAALGEAIRREPTLAEAYLQRARFRRLAGRDAEADRDVETARARGAGWAQAFHNEGVRLLNHGRALDAERWFRFATDVDPLRSESWMGMGRALMETNRPERAASAFEQAASIRKEDPETRYHRGNALRAIGRYEEALEAYGAAERLARRPAYPTGAGIIYQQEYRDPVRAEEAYARALAMEEAYPPALFNRAILYLELGRLEEAEKDMRRSLAKRGSAEGARVLASILNELGKHDAAVNVCMEALELVRDPAVREGLDDELRRALIRKEPR